MPPLTSQPMTRKELREILKNYSKSSSKLGELGPPDAACPAPEDHVAEGMSMNWIKSHNEKQKSLNDKRKRKNEREKKRQQKKCGWLLTK
jgi:hypothetical protein